MRKLFCAVGFLDLPKESSGLLNNDDDTSRRRCGFLTAQGYAFVFLCFYASGAGRARRLSQLPSHVVGVLSYLAGGTGIGQRGLVTL